jgi:hypothetical protein
MWVRKYLRLISNSFIFLNKNIFIVMIFSLSPTFKIEKILLISSWFKDFNFHDFNCLTKEWEILDIILEKMENYHFLFKTVFEIEN